MIQKVFNILKPLGIPVLFMTRPDLNKSKTGISYHFFNEGYDLYGDGKGKGFGGSLQVDIFSTVDYSNAVKQVINILESNGFRLSDARDSEDSLTDSIKYYQKILIFNYSERMVQDGS